MAAYAALLSLAQTTDLNTNPNIYMFSSDAKEKIRSIHEYVLLSLSFLENFPERVNPWKDKISDVAQKIEDIIDLFMWQKMEICYRRMQPSSVELEDLLNDATEEIGLIAGEMTYDSPAAAISSSSSSARLAPAGNDVVIGLDKDLMAMKERLCGESSNLQVVPIVGMGGIGKTTLARTIYDDPLIMSHFDVRAWLTVSQDYSPQRFKNILLGLADSMRLLQGGEMSGDTIIDDSEIALRVFQNLRYRRYLVVMDDVWGKAVWDDVRNIFPDDDNGSRILLTTRLSDVATYPHPDSPLHELQCMDFNQSWDLLKKKVFTNIRCPPDLEDIGKVIARSCAGLPLAIVLVAGLLSAVNDSQASWQEIAKTVNPIVGDLESDEILSLSYTHLPHHLRPCFLFMGGFREDAEILASTLTKLWVAEGFLATHRSGCSQSLEEEGEEYLEDLVRRNLVLVTRRNINGKIKSCSLHDMVRELSIRKAREEKFLHVMDGRVHRQGTTNEPSQISFHHSHIDYIWDPNIRTFLGFQLQNFPIWFLGRFRLLRVLDAVGDKYEELPSQIFELIHLRYLAFHCFLKIPSSISNLVNLQTLIIRPTLRYKRAYKNAHFSLPFEIWRMPQLRHLVFYGLYMLPHPPDGSNLPLQNLQTLSPIENLVWNEKLLQMIPNVKKLRLVYTINQEYHLHYLKYLHQLEKLEVLGYQGFSWRGKNPSFPWTLKKLTLVGGGFPWEDMAILGYSMPKLQVLKLINHACDGKNWCTAEEQFPQLEYLLIDESSLKHWTTHSSPLPRLKCLELRHCRDLAKIPEGIGEIPTLELIEVDSCTSSVEKSAKQIEEDQQNAGNDVLKVRCVHHYDEEIQSRHKGMNLSSMEREYKLKYVEEKIGLIAKEVLDGQPAYVPVAISSSSRPAGTGKGAVIGIHDDVKEIKDRLCGLSSDLQVIPITGEGGIGKTTLATTVYNDSLIMRHFQIRAWVTVVQNYTPQEILLHLAHSMKFLEEQMTGKGKSEVLVEDVRKKLKGHILGEKIDYSEMEKKVYKNLEGRRYLIVMDDVWSTEVWDDVRNIFPDDGNGSRIILTTRQMDVAAHPFFDRPVHKMRLMDFCRSWDLLKQKAFTSNNCPPHLEDIGKEMARMCAGPPLAVVLVAGVLSSVNTSRVSWEEIARNVNLVVGGAMEEILSLSYTHLPRHLRPCFLFIGGFPESANIRASRLIKLWVVEGFLEHQNGCTKSLEDEADGYLEDLVKRNLVIATSRKSNGRIKSCSLHNIVRGMCIRKAEEEKFLHFMDRSVLSQGMINERHISFSGSNIDKIWGPAIRTILCFHRKFDSPNWLIFSGDFRLLQALDGRHEELPSQVFELFNLRYLTLNASLNIPSTISNLANLQTLIIHPTSNLEKRYRRRFDEITSHSLPVEIWRMRQLRHIILCDPYMLPLPPYGSNLPLQNLQTLGYVNDLVWNEKILQMIPNVKRLRLVYTKRNEDAHLHLLKFLDQLEKLDVNGWRVFHRLRKKPAFPRTLKKLTLVNVWFPWEDMGIIGSLPNLQVLKLLDNACTGETWETADEEFPQLKFLLIDTSGLQQWITKSSHFPRLNCLVLRACWELTEIPEGIGEIPTLERIEVDQFCSKSLVESAKQIKKGQIQENNGNYVIQVGSHLNELRDELDTRPSIEELQSIEREARCGNGEGNNRNSSNYISWNIGENEGYME